MLTRLRRKAAPWVEWQNFQCLTLSWQAALAARQNLPRPQPALELRRLQSADLERAAADPLYDLSARFLRQLTSRNDPCFGAYAGAQLATYGFFSAAPTAIDEHLRFRFPARWIYVYKGFTHPDWRGKRLRPLVLLTALPSLATWLGLEQEPLGLVTLVVADNHASLKALRRIGFEKRTEFPMLRLRRRPWLLHSASPEGFRIARGD